MLVAVTHLKTLGPAARILRNYAALVALGAGAPRRCLGGRVRAARERRTPASHSPSAASEARVAPDCGDGPRSDANGYDYG